MKYAQINFDTLQMIGSPRALPARFTTAEGATINNFSSLPQAALYGLGWVPVTYEEIENAETHAYSPSPTYDEDDKQFVFPAVARNIDTLKYEAESAIDEAASDACARYISSGVGFDMKYLAKAAEADAYLEAYAADPETDATAYPILYAEAAAVGETCYERATLINDLATAWTAKAAEIEAARIGGKTNVGNSESNADVITARDTAIEALEAA